MQYIQSNTSTQAVNISSLRRSADGTPTIRRRSADLPQNQESLAESEKFFLFWVPMNSQQCWKAQLERALFYRVQSDKSTVC